MEDFTKRIEEAEKNLREKEKALAEAKKNYQIAFKKHKKAEEDFEELIKLKEENSEEEKIFEIQVLNIEKQYMNCSKVARVLVEDEVSLDEEIQLAVEVEKTAIVYIDLKMISEAECPERNISTFDMEIIDAVNTVYASGYECFSAEQIARVISGSPKQRVSAQRVDMIRRSIDKLRRVYISINCEEQFEKRKDTKGKVDTFVYESLLLPVTCVSAKYLVNGKKITAYHMTEDSALYRYASTIHEIIDIPMELFDVGDYFSDTDEAVFIKRYVLKRVAQIVRINKLKSNRISFSWMDKSTGRYRGLLNEMGFSCSDELEWKAARRRVKRIVKLLLQFLVDKRVITGFAEYRKDGSNNPASPVAGYQVFFDDSSMLRKKVHNDTKKSGSGK